MFEIRKRLSVLSLAKTGQNVEEILKNCVLFVYGASIHPSIHPSTSGATAPSGPWPPSKYATILYYYYCKYYYSVNRYTLYLEVQLCKDLS